MENQINHGLLTSDEAQAYLVSFGIPVKSRYTFYKYITENKIHFTDLTPWSRKTTRRFRQEDLDKYLTRLGVLNPVLHTDITVSMGDGN